MEEYVTRIGDVTIQRVIPGGAGPDVEPVSVMESEDLLRAVKQEPLDDDDDEDEEEDLGEGEEEEEAQGVEDDENKDEEALIRIKEEPRDEEEENDEVENDEVDETENRQSDNDEKEAKDDEEKEGEGEEDAESSKRKADSDEDSENLAKKKKMENETDADKKKISNLRRNIREVMDEAQLDEATLAAQRQEAERLRRVQDQQKYLIEVQRQIQLNKQNSKTQSRVISLLQGGSTSLLKTSSASSSSTINSSSSGPSTVLVKLGSGQQQALNRKTLEVLRGGKTVATSEPARPGITRVTPGNRPAMVTPSVSIAPVKPIIPEGQKKDSCDTDVVTISSSSDSEDDCILISEGEGEEEEEEDDVDTTNSGMHTNDLYNIPDEQGRVLINVGKPESEPEIYLAPQIARIIKPHQIGGVRFLFDNLVESIERFNNSTGFGCILAHSMGLGKTLQVVSFCDVFLRETSAKTVMCIMPINTLQNWMAEFNLWLPSDPTVSSLAVHGEIKPRNFGIFVLNDMHKTIAARAKVVEEWNREGGVLLIGYEMYRQLSLKRPGRLRKGKKRPPDEDIEDEKNKPLLEAMHEALVRPGPDLVICDEGHRIKNSHASISHALKQIRTKRRVVLTGYPLQNNLLEYWCMVDFVRPNYLGTKTEFSNMFERPIQNGQCIDSTPQDIRLMRYRAHVLHSLLEGFVQRRSHSVLRNTLPQKEEYVILIRMTSFQRKLYDTFMNEVVRTKAVPNPLKAFAVCCKIWNHPDILYHFIKKKELDELQDLDIEETANLHTGPNSPRRPLGPKDKKGKTVKKQAQIAAVKPEIAAPPPQPQATTPEVKTEDRKFDFPSGQGNTAGPPGYGEYYPPPPYQDLSYPYHRPPAPGMYYPGYYPENQGYYPGYESGGYPGYFSNFGPYSGSKNEEFDKQSQSWGTNYVANKEKNLSKSPKDIDSSKPGYQEFYPIKEEKTEIKEEKQFLCGFSGGQVSYNYQNYGGYGYPPQDYQSGWNKGTFPTGSGERTAPMVSSESSEQKNAFSNSNQIDSAHKLTTSQDRTQSQLKPNQSAPHGLHERNQSNQNINETHSLQSSSDQQRLLSNQEHLGGNQNMHTTLESMQAGRMSMAGGQRADDQQRRSSLENVANNQQGLFENQRDQNTEGFDNLMRNRSNQEADPNRLRSNMQSVQQSLHSTHEQLQRSHLNSIYGNKNTHENEYRNPGNQERSSSGQPLFSNIPGNKDYLPSNHTLNSRQSIQENSRIPNSQDQHLIHQQNSFQESQVCLPNPQEQISGTAMFASQEHQNSSRNLQNIHDSQHKAARNQDNLSSNQQSLFGNQRSDHKRQGNKEHISSTQQNIFESQRIDHGMQVINQEHISNSQKSLFGNQRNEHNIHVNPETMPSDRQNFFANPRNDHNRQVNPDNLQINQQNMYATRGDRSLHQGNSEHLTSSHHNVPMNQRSDNIETAQNLYSNQRNEHNIPNSSEQIQQNMYAKQRAEHNLQRTSEQISTAQQDLFCNPRSDGNMHSNVGGSPRNMFVNQRADHGTQISEDRGQFSHQALIGNRTDSQRRGNMGPEHLTLSNQQTMLSGRNDHGSQTNQENLHHGSSGNAEKDLQHRVVSNQDQMTGNQQMFGNPRNEIVPGNTDRVHRHQEGYIGNQHIHERESKQNTQSLKNTTPQNIFAGQRIDHNAHTTSEHNSQQNIAGIGERMNQDCFGNGSNRFGNQDSFQGSQPSMFRGQNIHDNHHSLQTHMSQQNIYGNQLMDRGVLGSQELQGNSQTASSQSHHQATKRSSSTNDHISVAQQQESYISQGNDHSTQKIKKTDNQLDNQQMVRSAQECSQSQFNMFPVADGHYRTCNDQEVAQSTRTNVGDSQNSQESQHRMHIHSRDRHLGNPSHNTQDQKQSSHNLFGNQNVQDSQRWLHNSQEFTGSQQNLFESHGTHSRDNPFQINQNIIGNKNLSENQQKFHGSQERVVTHPQQNFFTGQSNQTGIQRQEHIGGKQQHIQENQYLQDVRMQEHQQNAISNVERQGSHNSQDSLHGSSQNAMGRKNIPEHLSDLQSTQVMASSPGMYGNQVHRNLQGEVHGNQEHILTHHNTMGNIMAGKHGNQEYGHNNQCGTGNFQNIPGSNLASMHQQGGHNNPTHGLSTSQHSSTVHNQEMRKGNQNVTPSQNYGMQNAPQMLSSHESHPGNQSGIPTGQQNMFSNQNLSRPQHGVINPKEAQQESANDNISSNQQSSYGNQFHIQNSQQISNSHHHMQGSQHNMPTGSANTPMFGNQHMLQGNVQVVGGGSQGLHGSQQTHAQNNQQHMMSGTLSLLHNKELPQGKQGGSNTSNFSGAHAQYMLSASQQNVPVTPHSIHGQHTAANQATPNNQAEQQKTQENSQQKMKSNQGLSVNQQGTQTGPDNTSLMGGTQHRVQNMLVQPTHQQTQNSFDSTIIMSSKAMSGGQVMQGNQQHKQEIKNTQFSPEDQSRYKGQFDEQFMNDRFQGDYSKPGFMGQDFQFPYQNQFPFKENQYSDQPGPSGQQFRKDDKCEEGNLKDADKNHREGEESAKTMSTSSTNTDKEEDRDKKDKKDDDDKIEKKEGTSKSGKEDPGIPYDWATELLKGYVPGDIQSSAKMAVFFCILEESIVLGDRILLFSQSLFTLNLMEELLQQQLVPGKEEERWARNVNYYRLDGSTTAMEREKLINEFNSNSNLHLFLVSTRAGSLGINLVGANRVIVFDASWNPCHDTQAVCRVYRYGQKKPCFVYRLVTDNCLEKKIYDRQINKQGMSDRVVDECNPDAHLSIKEVTSLCWDDKTDDESPKDFSSLQDSYIDVVLQKVIQNHSNFLSKEPFQHESLLVDRKEKKLSQAEKRLAKRSYELEKQATTRPVYNGVQPNQARPKPMASVRPMQAEMGNTRQRGWIPASVWQRQGMSAQEMTLPLDVVIPTNAADRASIVLKAGQKVMVLKSPKGIYMQLENGKIIAIRTAFKVGANKKPGEQQGKGTEMSRRGGRQQMISPRGRPVRAVGPVSRPPPVTVTVTRKRPPEEEPPAVRNEEVTPSTGHPPTAPVTPMEVSSAENDVPNPFTAAAAASLSSMQLPQQQNSQSPVSQQTQPTAPLLPQSQPVPSSQESQNQQPVQHTEQPMQPQAQHHQQPLVQSQQPLPPVRYQQQPIQQSQHQQQPLLQSQHLQHPIQLPKHPQSQSIPQQQLSQHPQQHSHLSQQLPPTQLQQQPIVQPQHPHQHISHPQLVQHQHSQSQLPPQQLHQPIPHHQLPPQPIPPHSQIPPHPQQPMTHSPLLSQIPQHPISHPQHSQQTHLHQTQLSVHPMSHPPMQSHPIPPHSQMNQSIPHLQLSQQPLPLQQFPQQPIHPQAQHPQHYEPPPIPPLVGDQLT